MEKYSQFRDKGTAIAPFLPVPTPPAGFLWAPIHLTLFLLRAPAFLFLSLFYFGILEHLPAPALFKRFVLGFTLAIPGVWWVDLQIDGVKRGKLVGTDHLPHKGTIIASNFTSPVDSLYLAGVFTPIFTRSWPGERRVEVISMFRAMMLAFSPPQLKPPSSAKLVTLESIFKEYPEATICVFPECTTTNGRGILPLSPSLLSADPKTKIYPVNVRYTPNDITTPVPGDVHRWMWRLLSKPTHYIRVRIARPVYNSRSMETPNGTRDSNTSGADMGFDTNIWDSPHMRDGLKHEGEREDAGVSAEEQKVLDRVAEDLARMGRVKRVGLGLEDKAEFVRVWGRKKR